MKDRRPLFLLDILCSRARPAAAPVLIFALALGLSSPARGGELDSPTGVEASDGAYSTKAGVAWEHVRHAKTYEVFRGTEENPASAVSAGVTESILFFDSTAEPGRTYYYWVQAHGEDGQSLWSAPDTGFRAEGRNNLFGPIAPLRPPEAPPENPVTGAKVYLGKTLFWDEQLSATRTIACGTCHRPRAGGSDPRSLETARPVHPGRDGIPGNEDDIAGSPGVPSNRADGGYEWSAHFGLQEQVTHRKAQPVINAAYCTNKDCAVLWDGRAGQQFQDPLTGEVVIEGGAALETQALIPLLNTTEMAHGGRDWQDVVSRLRESQPLALSPSLPAALARWIGPRGYPELFEEAFGTPEITPVRIAMAIASYERTLFSDRAPLDLYVSEIREMPAAVARGRDVFFEARCDACHQGGQLGDNRFRSIGVRPIDDDKGRYEVTGNPVDLGRFRTPSLRNVALRAPYMHNGGLKTLEEVVEFYNRGGDFDPFTKDDSFIRPLFLSEQEKADLVVFLRDALTDPRVASAAGPLFDRPMLYSESARRPLIEGGGRPGEETDIPAMQAIEPPLAGNPNFTVGLEGVAPGVEAVLVVDDEDPVAGPRAVENPFLRRRVTAADNGRGGGYASVSFAVPEGPALQDATLFGRWFVGGAVSPRFRAKVFSPSVAPAGEPAVCTVSAASLAIGLVAPESVVTAFGTDLAPSEQAAKSLPLPTELAGVSVGITDSEGERRLAPLFYVSPEQINYQVPAGTALGEAAVTVLRGGVAVASGRLQAAHAAPALFAANANGRGPAAALALRVAPDGARTHRPASEWAADQQRFVSAPIELGDGSQVFLLLFGTGIRGGSQVSASIGGETAEVIYAGPQGEFAGLDQVNVRVPDSLAGRGEVDVAVTVDGHTSNAVRVTFR